MKTRLAFVIVVGLLAIAQDGSADEPDAQAQAQAQAQAKEAFRAGVSAFNEEQYEEAAGLFRRAYEIKPSWKLLFNIGQCEAALKHYGLALDAFESYLAQGGDAVPRERQQEVLSEVQRLREMVGYLEMIGEEGDVVLVDQSERGVLPLGANLRLSVGQARVTVLRGRGVVLDRVVEILGTQTTTVAVEEPSSDPRETGEAGAPGAPGAEAEELENKKRPMSAWMSFGAAGAAAVGAAITGGLALSARHEVDSHCEKGVCPTAYRDDEERALALAVTTDVLLGVAAVGVALGVVFLLMDEDEDTERESPRVTPAFSGDAAGVMLTGRF